MVTFSSSFVWDGVSNIVVDICHNNSMAFASPYGGVRAATLTNGGRFIRAADGGAACAVLPPRTLLANRPQVRFNYTGSRAGDPDPGNTEASANPVCSGAPLTLSLQNATTGSGVSYQWYVSTVSATPGVKRMRIRDVWNTAGNLIDPCINYGYGETEDYDVTIDPPPACPSPSSLVASSPTANSVTLNWNIGCTETAWEVEYGAPGFALGTGTVVPAGTNVAFVLGGLASTTAYEAYVRADCGVDGVSGWLGPVSFTTLAPPPANDDCANATPLTVGL
ncbi:MAG: fibronectin type III domain-containing protein [Flavobacteriales bacterium]|nr:fibronectin type III domain-containing protein [Flavobacteriales bacterium]